MGDDLAGTLDVYIISDANVLGANVVFVVERGLPYGCAADVDRIQDGVRVEAAGPADVYADVQHPGGLLRSGELERHGPSRLAADVAQVLLEIHAVDLDDRPIAAVVQVIFGLEPLLVEVDRLFGGGHETIIGIRS